MQEYTIALVDLFVAAVEEREKTTFQQRIIAARMAEYPEQEFKAAMKELGHG